MVGRLTNAVKTKNKNLAHAQRILLETRKTPPVPTTLEHVTPENGEADDESSGDDVECTGWTGGISNYVSSDDEPIIISDDDEEEEVEKLSGSELEEMAQKHLETMGVASHSITELDLRSAIMCKQTEGDWRRAESHRALGYNRQSGRTKRRHEQFVREKEEEDAKLRKR